MSDSPLVPFSGALSAVVKPTADKFGETISLAFGVYLEPLNERLRIKTKERTARVFDQAAKRIADRGADPALLIDAPPELLTAAIIANASSVDAPELQQMFAGRLATAAIRPAGAARPWMTEALRQLDGPAARLLALLHAHEFIAADGPRSSVGTTRPDGRVVNRESPPTLSGQAVAGRQDVSELSPATPLLSRLARIEVERGKWGVKQAFPGGGFQQVDVRERIEIRLSDFGSQLCNVCLT